LPGDDGYWIVTSSGGVHAFGRAKIYPGKVPAGSDITAIASSPDGKGYCCRARRGRDGLRRRSVSRIAPIDELESVGRWDRGHEEREGLLARYGLRRRVRLRQRPGLRFAAGGRIEPADRGIAATPDGYGYWLVSSSGKVYNFGAARNLGGTTSAAAIGV